MSYDVEQDLSYVEENIAVLMYIVGLDPDDITSVSIDDFISSARDIVRTTSIKGEPPAGVGIGLGKNASKVYMEQPALQYLRAQRISLIANIRRFWYLRQLAIGAANRG
jgi:hypothetical protein